MVNVRDDRNVPKLVLRHILRPFLIFRKINLTNTYFNTEKK